MKMLSRFTKRSFASQIFIALCAIMFFIVSAHLFLQYLNLEVYYQQNGFIYELSNRFDLDDEASVPSWFSQFLFLLISVSAAIAAYLSTNMKLRRLWMFIGIIGLGLSVDETAGLHEFALQSIHNIFFRDSSPTSTNNAWLLVTPFIITAALWSLWKISQLLPRRTLILFASSFIALLTGAILVDMAASVSDRETFFNQGILIAIEESLEIIANIIAIYAIVDFIQRNHKKQLKAALDQLK